MRASLVPPLRRIAAVALPALVLLLVALPADPAAARGSLQAVEKEFREAIKRVEPTAVVCVAEGAKDAEVGFGSSGVIISRDGYVLTDSDVGVVRRQVGGKLEQTVSDKIEVRVPNLELGGFQTYRAEVVHRFRPIDSALLKISEVPASGFPDYLEPASSDGVRVGDYLFVTGNAWNSSKEAPPATTAGVAASLTALPAGDAGGRIELIYTSAAVNPGVNGGPVVDVEGRLIGIVSTFLPPDPGEPYQFLGKIMPMDRIRAVYGGLDGVKQVFRNAPKPRRRNGEAASLETAFRHAAHVAYPAVVSLEVDRKQPLSTQSPGMGGIFPVPRFRGPVSGVLLDDAGWILTSLYNLTNVAPLMFRGWQATPPDRVATGLESIKSVTVYLSDGRKAEARYVAHDGRLGVVLLKAEMPAPSEGSTRPAEPRAAIVPAPPEVFAEGRFVIAVGNPFGAKPNPDPLLTVGILSKFHADSVAQPYRGEWQTDAAITDANCGGALVDLRGRLVGLLHIWSPMMHGRNSGIGFVVPWNRLEAALPALKEGRCPRRGWLGVEFGGEQDDTFIKTVVDDSPAAKAGIQAGDRVIAVDGRPTNTRGALIQLLLYRWEGESLVLTVRRGGEEQKIDVVLGGRT